MIIFGSRMYGKRDVVHGHGECEHCGKYSKNTSYTGRKWGHLYFIPLIPMDSSVRVLNECKSCSMGQHLPESNVSEVKEDLRQSMKSALAALIAGESDFEYQEGIALPCTLFLANNIQTIKSLYHEDFIELVLASLKEKNLEYTYQMIHGRLLEFEGKLQEAAQAYEQAMQLEPDENLPLLSLAAVQYLQKDYIGARQTYERTLQSLEGEDRLGVLSSLVTIYEEQKDFTSLTEAYEECLQIEPGFQSDKNFMKAYKKACKKAAREPIVG